MLLIIKFFRFLVGPMIIIIGLTQNSYAQDKTALQQKRTATMKICLLYTSPSPRDRQKSRMPSSA